ncbi:hypothetical protein [Stenotrophomonas maltophilia]|uniref:hypothetical protein n=1 Tax=Stenotrophomonas maltophilia TaxID=40324 RepID=UPI0013DAFAF3|nr:hypothetical protein [Stenotrophomonas maltophilia]
MDAIAKRARELLAVEYEKFDLPSTAAGARAGAYDLNPSMRAVVAALTPPDGYVLVPVVPTKQMMDAAVPTSSQDQTGRRQRAVWGAMLAARPEAPS